MMKTLNNESKLYNQSQFGEEMQFLSSDNCSDMVTEDEMDNYVIDQETFKYIEQFRIKNKYKKSEMKILDWGCGIGRAVAYLRKNGYDCVGIDIDPERIAKAKPFFEKRGILRDELLTLLDENGRTVFPDEHFDFIFSNQVIEHIKDIDAAVSEMSRITKRNGMGFHVFPAHRGFIEEHLHMPFVHWFPKNKLRKLFILLCLTMGMEPKWKRLEKMDRHERADAYYNYTVNNTYYRKYKTIGKIFTQKSFIVNYVSVDHYKVKRISPFIFKMTKTKILRETLNWGLLNFKAVCLLGNKI